MYYKNGIIMQSILTAKMKIAWSCLLMEDAVRFSPGVNLPVEALAPPPPVVLIRDFGRGIAASVVRKRVGRSKGCWRVGSTTGCHHSTQREDGWCVEEGSLWRLVGGRRGGRLF
jgi:hypothetical protein